MEKVKFRHKLHTEIFYNTCSLILLIETTLYNECILYSWTFLREINFSDREKGQKRVTAYLFVCHLTFQMQSLLVCPQR